MSVLVGRHDFENCYQEYTRSHDSQSDDCDRSFNKVNDEDLRYSDVSQSKRITYKYKCLSPYNYSFNVNKKSSMPLHKLNELKHFSENNGVYIVYTRHDIKPEIKSLYSRCFFGDLLTGSLSNDRFTPCSSPQWFKVNIKARGFSEILYIYFCPIDFLLNSSNYVKDNYHARALEYVKSKSYHRTLKEMYKH